MPSDSPLAAPAPRGHGASSANLDLERLPQGLKLRCLLLFELFPDVFELPNGFRRIKALAAPEANLGADAKDCSVNSPSQELLDLFF